MTSGMPQPVALIPDLQIDSKGRLDWLREDKTVNMDALRSFIDKCKNEPLKEVLTRLSHVVPLTSAHDQTEVMHSIVHAHTYTWAKVMRWPSMFMVL